MKNLKSIDLNLRVKFQKDPTKSNIDNINTS